MASRTYLALDGSAGTIDAPGLHGSPPTSVVEVSVNSRLHELYGLPAGTGKRCTEHVHSVPALTEEYEYRGRPLRVGGVGPMRLEDLELKQFLKVAVWEGPHHDAVTHRYWASTNDLVGFLDLFDLNDRPNGLVAPIRESPNASAKPRYTKDPSLVERVPDIGLIQYQRLNRNSGRILPHWRGRRTKRGAELFVEHPGRFDMYFVLATATGLAVITPNPDKDPDFVVARLEETLITWR